MDELFHFFKSVLDQDKCSVVICDIRHTIIYMNSAAKANYAKKGGENLIGCSIFSCHNERSVELIIKVVDLFKQSKENNIVHTFYNPKQNKDVYMVALRDENDNLIGYYEKHEFRNIDESPFYSVCD